MHHDVFQSRSHISPKSGTVSKREDVEVSLAAAFGPMKGIFHLAMVQMVKEFSKFLYLKDVV